MKRICVFVFCAAATLLFCLGVALAQRGDGDKADDAPPAEKEKKNGGEDKPSKRTFPTDPKLLDIYRDFIRQSEELAKQYEQKKEFDKARVVYEEILKVIPQHEPSKKKLRDFFAREAGAERAALDVHANRAWQDTGITVLEGKPITIRAQGTWTFAMSHRLGPVGMEIPKELRDFNLGSLIGRIVGPDDKDLSKIKPFTVGQQLELLVPKTGRLELMMYDSRHEDNEGKLRVEFVGTFRKK